MRIVIVDIEKTMRMNALFDFYQSLLTPKQQEYIKLYYLDDFSLGEIADTYEVSRQAVYDNIKRTEVMLEQYEEKLLMFKKYQERKDIILRLKNEANDNDVLISTIEELEQME